MAKRARGAVRPGQRRPGGRPQPRPNTLRRDAQSAPGAPATRPGGLTVDEEQRAAEIEARIVEQEREADATRRRSTARERERELGGGDSVPGRSAQAGGLAAQASEEYAYVVRDVRRIVTIGGGLVVVLAVLFVLIEVAHVIRL
jgi:hypothetical protein